MAAARCAREAKPPLETLPPPRFAPDDWMRDAALLVIPLDFAMIHLLQMVVEWDWALPPRIPSDTHGHGTKKLDKNFLITAN